MRNLGSMGFLNSVIALHQWPLPLSRTSYTHVITSIAPHTQYRQGTAPPSHILCLALRIQDYYDSENLLAIPTCVPEVHCEPRRIRTSPTDPPNEPVFRLCT